MKTALTKEEVESILHPTASAEYIGDIFEFWLGMLELGIQFPTMFKGWGANLDSSLAGLEESFWLFCNSCRHADTINTKRNRTRKAYIPPVENALVTLVLKEAQIFELLIQHKITRMPVIPTANYDDHPRRLRFLQVMKTGMKLKNQMMIPRRHRREVLGRSKLQVKQKLGMTTSRSMKRKKTWGANLLRQRSDALKFETFVTSSRR